MNPNPGQVAVAAAFAALPPLGPQPTLWYRDDWPTIPFGKAKIIYINESRWERWEVYNSNFRQWHWRICEEMLGFTFDPQSIKTPLQLMAGEKDDYPYVHSLSNVKNLAGTLRGPGRALTILDTGHSIHNERPSFLGCTDCKFSHYFMTRAEH